MVICIIEQTDAMPKPHNKNPHPNHIREYKPMGCKKRLIKKGNVNVNFCTPEKVERLFPAHLISWQNPCLASSYTDVDVQRKQVSLDPLKLHLKSMLRIKYGSCNKTDDSTTNWCHEKPRYTFFEHSTRTDKLCLRLEHKRLQVFVAGLSYLARFNENDRRHNLKRIVQDARTLLCEMETVINQTGCVKSPKPLTPKEMCLRMNLHSLSSEDDTEVDVIFAKANFGKYLRGLSRTLNGHNALRSCHRSKTSRNKSRQLSGRQNGSSNNINILGKTNQGGVGRRKHRQDVSARKRLLKL